MKLNNSPKDKTPKKKKSTWHRWFFGLLYLCFVAGLFMLFYNFVVRDNDGKAGDDAAATTGKEMYDTLDVLGDYLWPGMKLDTSKDEEEKKEAEKKEDTKTEQRHAAPVVEAEAATDVDIEEATGLSAGDPATSAPSADDPQVKPMESPKVEQLESPAQ